MSYPRQNGTNGNARFYHETTTTANTTTDIDEDDDLILSLSLEDDGDCDEEEEGSEGGRQTRSNLNSVWSTLRL